jgi:PAS domain-containing protein
MSNGEKKEVCRLDGFIKSNIDSRALGQKIKTTRMVTSATPPFHVEWVSGEWSRAFGWSSEEIQGLDCKFLQGDVTDKRQISNFMSQLLSDGGYAEMEVLNYRKDNVLIRNRIRCAPLSDDCGPHNKTKVSHIGVTADLQLLDHHVSGDGDDTMELGMPLDRRENCAVYDKCGDLPPPSIQEWATLTENLALALTMRYMLRSQAPIALLDRLVIASSFMIWFTSHPRLKRNCICYNRYPWHDKYVYVVYHNDAFIPVIVLNHALYGCRSNGRIVHVNINWCHLTGYPAVVADGLQLRALFGRGTSTSSTTAFDKFLEECCTSEQTKDRRPSDSSSTDIAPSPTSGSAGTSVGSAGSAGGAMSPRRRVIIKPITIDVSLVVRLPQFRMVSKEVYVTLCPAVVGKHHIAVLFANASQIPSDSHSLSLSSTSSSSQDLSGSERNCRR